MPLKHVTQLFIGGGKFDWWESITITNRLNALSDITIRLPNNKGQFSTRHPNGMAVSVLTSWDTEVPTPFWQGVTERRNIEIQDDISFISLWGRDAARILDCEYTVDDYFELYPDFTGTYGQLIQYMNSLLSSPLTLDYEVSSDDFEIVKVFEYEKTFQELTKAAERGGYEWFLEGRANVLVVRPPRELVQSNVIKTYLLGPLENYTGLDLQNATYMTGDKLEVDASDQITRVRFDGLGSVSAVHPASQPTVVKEYYEQSNEWATTIAALQAAVNYYNTHRYERISLEISIPFGEAEVNVGDVIMCDDSVYGLSTIINKLYRVIEVTHTFTKKSWRTDFQLGDFTPRLTDYL